MTEMLEDERRELANLLAKQCTLPGTFVLRSGMTSTSYFDKYQFESDPALLRRVVRQLAQLVPSETELLAGLELGGVPIATALALETGLPAVFVRKSAKTYGTARLAEGAEVDARRCLIVEDVVTTGGQIALSTIALRAVGAIVADALCVVDRSGGDTPQLAEVSVALRSLYVGSELQQRPSA